MQNTFLEIRSNPPLLKRLFDSLAFNSNFLFSCKNDPVFLKTKPFKNILDSPSTYNKKIVILKCKLTEFFIAFRAGYFIIVDNTESIAETLSKTFPITGEEVKIRGDVKSAFVIGNKRVMVIIEEKEK